MVKIIIGRRGSGKTKRMVELIEENLKSAKGNIVCIEKCSVLTFTLPHTVRLVDVDNYSIDSYDRMYGFMSGMMAGNYDIESIFTDAILRIGGRDYEALTAFLDKMEVLSNKEEVNVVFTVSEDEQNLPESILKYVK